MRCINATKRTRFSSLFVAIVEAVTAAIEEAYFWSTTHAEADPDVDSGGERQRQTERRKDEEEE